MELQARTTASHADAAQRAAAAHLEYLLKQPIPQEIAEVESPTRHGKGQSRSERGRIRTLYVVRADRWRDQLARRAAARRANRPGTTVWGEIVDLSEIDARSEVTPEQADQLAVGTAAELVWPETHSDQWAGRLVFIGPVADAQTGLVPIVARLTIRKSVCGPTSASS